MLKSLNFTLEFQGIGMYAGLPHTSDLQTKCRWDGFSIDGGRKTADIQKKKEQNLYVRSLGTSFFPVYAPGRKGQRWTVQTCLTCQRSQRFLNDPKHLLWGDRPEAQLENQAGEQW